VRCHGSQINVIVLQYVAALASPGQKRKTKSMSAHSTSISLDSGVINLEKVKRLTSLSIITEFIYYMDSFND
jgi:hypothetical protein